MTRAEQLAAFAVRASYEELSEAARRQLKLRVLDALGCAIGAVGSPPLRLIRTQIDDFGGAGRCTLIGGGRTAPDRAAFYNSALVRYLDFNDSYLAPGETCHPSDNLGAVLAAAEYAWSGRGPPAEGDCRGGRQPGDHSGCRSLPVARPGPDCRKLIQPRCQP